MARPKEPIELVIARGKKHLTKSEIKERRDSEVQPILDEVVAPPYLTAKQTKEFYKIANQLIKLKIFGETDVDTLARYIVANDMYINAVKQLRKKEVNENILLLEIWSKTMDRYFKQCSSVARDLGLTISSRCKLVIPTATTQETVNINKFAKFEKRSNSG